MKRLHRFLCVLTLFALVLTLAGCAASENASSAPSSSEPALLPESAPESSEPESLPEPEPEPEPEPSPYPLHETAVKNEVSIQFGGDVILHYYPVKSALHEDGSYDFSPYFDVIKDYLTADLKVCNMEGAVDDSLPPSAYPCFNYPSEIITDCMDAGFNFFFTANNHSFDKGWSGLVNTRNAFLEKGAEFTGTYETQEQFDTPTILNYGGIEIGFVVYTYGDNGMITTIPAEYRPFAMREFNHSSTKDAERMLADVRACRDAGADFVVLALHWGAEYHDEPSETQVALAEMLINEPDGPDILLGNHAHAVQPVEMHTVKTENGPINRLIVYALGNLFADQSDVHVYRTRTSQIVNVKLNKQPDGRVLLTEANYMPCMTYINEQIRVGPDRYRVLPIGVYAQAAEKPDVFATEKDWQFCKDSWDRLREVIGDSIPCVTGAEIIASEEPDSEQSKEAA